MRLVGTTNVMLAPETTEEAGIMYWLAQRFAGKRVQITFDTTMHHGCGQFPMMWIVPYGNPLPVAEESFDERKEND